MLRALCFAASVLLLAIAPGSALASVENGSADAVLGQVDFAGAQCALGPRNMCAPARMAVAPSGRLYVSDTNNNRVLSWPSAQQFSNGQAADLVLGQSDFTTNSDPTCATTPDFVPSSSSMCQPGGLVVDSFGRLYVADTLDNRVLRFTSKSNGHAADLVLGQPDFVSRQGWACGAPDSQPTATSFCAPYGLAVDSFGRLWVADAMNDRVVRFDWIRANGQAADLVLGQPGMTSRGCNGTGQQFFVGQLPNLPATSMSMCQPLDVAVDSFNRVYVADAVNSRVLRFDLPRANGEAASLALGQPDFASNACDAGSQTLTSALSLCWPSGVAVDNWSRVYVADYWNDRVVRFDQPHQSGVQASVVLGQADMSSRQCNRSVAYPQISPNATDLCHPEGVTIDAARHVYIADAGNNRVLRFN